MEKNSFSIEDYDYKLPEELIAQFPLEKRDSSRLLVIDRKNNIIKHDSFSSLPSYFSSGDLFVVNNTKVIPARVYGRTQATGAGIEILLLDKNSTDTWEVMMKNSRRVAPGSMIDFPGGLKAEVTEKTGKTVSLKFNLNDSQLKKKLQSVGVMPLPPYIRENTGAKSHKHTYQTVYAKKEGAKAAPTAGLHFTKELLNRLRKNGIKNAEVTLHVGLGTFEPLVEKDIREHKMHAEHYEITKECAKLVNSAKENGNKVVCVGTTSLRALESAYKNKLEAGSGSTSIYIYPGYKFRTADCLITNFHLPRTTLLALIYAFAGPELAKKAYNEAIKEKYRFFSYGDAMLII